MKSRYGFAWVASMLALTSGCHLIAGYDDFKDATAGSGGGTSQSGSGGATQATTGTMTGSGGATTATTGTDATTSTTSTTSTGPDCDGGVLCVVAMSGCTDCAANECACASPSEECVSDPISNVGSCKIADGFACNNPMDDTVCATGDCCYCTTANFCYEDCSTAMSGTCSSQ